jgi:hypothetical protein
LIRLSQPVINPNFICWLRCNSLGVPGAVALTAAMIHLPFFRLPTSEPVLPVNPEKGPFFNLPIFSDF